MFEYFFKFKLMFECLCPGADAAIWWFYLPIFVTLVANTVLLIGSKVLRKLNLKNHGKKHRATTKQQTMKGMSNVLNLKNSGKKYPATTKQQKLECTYIKCLECSLHLHCSQVYIFIAIWLYFRIVYIY